jgi:C1A family cysteine protease
MPHQQQLVDNRCRHTVPTFAALCAVVDFDSFFKKGSPNVQAVYRPGKDATVKYYHAVVLVGYNNDHNPPYWVAKNSYGPEWGDNGFFKV